MFSAMPYIQWRVFIICISFMMFVLVVFNQYVSADDAYLWMPAEMIQGIMYEGILVLKEPTGGVFKLTLEDSSKITVDDTVTILPGSNHGIFKIMPQQNGEVMAYVEVDNELVTASSNIYSAGGQVHGLNIILPSNTTKAKVSTGFIIIVDANGAAAVVSGDTDVSLTSSESIVVPDVVTIKAGTHYAKFKANIRGSGTIFASSPSLEHTEYKIEKLQNEITVKVIAAPAVAMQNSQVLITTWLEKDGRPFKPPHVVDVYISSSNTDTARIEKFSGSAYNDVALVSMIDGINTKQITTYNEGVAMITSNVKGFGSGQTPLIVGPAEPDIIFEFLRETVDRSSSNMAIVWSYPHVGTDKFAGVASLYTIEYKDEGHVTKNFTSIPSRNNPDITIKKIIPIIPNEQTVLLSSAGLTHPDSLLMRGSVMEDRLLHAVKFNITAKNFGMYNMYVSGPDLSQTQTKIISRPSYEETYKLTITPIPTLANVQQPLALICIVDSDGNVLDMVKTLGINTYIVASIENVIQKLFFVKESCTILHGKIEKASLIVISARGLEPIYKEVHPVQTAAAIKIYAPKKIHVAEEIPFVVHKINSVGIPFAVIKLDSIIGDVDMKEQRLLTHTSGIVDVIGLTSFGMMEFSMESFVNQMYFEVLPEFTSVNVGKNLVVAIDSDTTDLDVNVNSPVPVREMPDGTFLLTPIDEGIFTIAFSAKKEGYTTTSSEFTLTVKKTIKLAMQAIGNDGMELNVGIHSGNESFYGSLSTPQTLEIRPGQVNFEFPLSHVVDNRSYNFSKVSFNEHDIQHVNGNLDVVINSDGKLIVHYERTVRINVVGAVGSGIYSYGDKVILSALPRDVYSFLVREVYDSWVGFNGNDSQIVSFIATSDVDGYVVYRNDYSGLMIISTIIITGVISCVLLRTRLNYLVFNSKSKTDSNGAW